MIIGEKEGIAPRQIRGKLVHVGFKTFKGDVEIIGIVSEIDSR